MRVSRADMRFDVLDHASSTLSAVIACAACYIWHKTSAENPCLKKKLIHSFLRSVAQPCPVGGTLRSSFGILLHLFSASIFLQKVFRGSKITRAFLQPFCNREVGNSTGAWQAGRYRRAHGEDNRLKSSASASKWID